MGTRKAEFQSWKSIYHLLCIFLYIHIDLHVNQNIYIYTYVVVSFVLNLCYIIFFYTTYCTILYYVVLCHGGVCFI